MSRKASHAGTWYSDSGIKVNKEVNGLYFIYIKLQGVFIVYFLI